MSNVELRDHEILLVRHAAVAEKYRGICYGQTDVELSAAGEAFSRDWLRSVIPVAVKNEALLAAQPPRFTLEVTETDRAARVLRKSTPLVSPRVMYNVSSTPRIYHSDLRRTRFLAELLADQFQVQAKPAAELRERDFGEWELRSWETIHAEVGDEMIRMIRDPETYRPGGGETTFELRDRVMRWWNHLPAGGPVIVITHGGMIAALMGTLCGCRVETWPELIPVYGAAITINRG